ncbi:SDR family NAD(P)-dependent oxidoreductase [Terriglobus saanensis]|uniref:Short-chain dehydrogenase/reductase SDR n=1 Tax=Terriglobus saanensis (strain ATCC BAA-1853 / DSM 23119 / SP1PR4) TaxID=401053 RepID=E8V5C3_TERSS|nr:SDR family NAD(P)-dependent oxidoreductase [Terriglobus saanensis]ADV84882.1 short-chain dehydrogenase/reductase SDR [Terriglobus saanensis SP1PR4]
MAKKVWFITGASRGFGRIWAEAALERGDLVAATARKLTDVEDLSERFGDRVLPLALDVTDTEQVKKAVAAAYGHFGRLDVVLNNAGYSLVGMIEEVSEGDVRTLFETNVFGTLRVIQAALPFLRAQGSGHIVGVSSMLGLTAIPLLGLYCSSKWAFESLHESLAQEVKAFGIQVTLLEPGAYATDFGNATSAKTSAELEAYNPLRQQVASMITNMEKGDPRATSDAALTIVDAEAPPLRLFIGSSGLPRIRSVYEARIALWEKWSELSNSAQGRPQN